MLTATLQGALLVGLCRQASPVKELAYSCTAGEWGSWDSNPEANRRGLACYTAAVKPHRARSSREKTARESNSEAGARALSLTQPGVEQGSAPARSQLSG